ncbi:MAG: SpoIIE family protein phosphatase [Spirochaetes bacterium]|nr:SpoIIE family protein phosphatase [Spirochaetota bacterium]
MEVEQIKILVLDDDMFIGKMLVAMLAGYHVKCTTSFSQFQQIIEEFNPDIAIIDLQLPDAYGLDVCKWIRSQRQYDDIILYILTSTDDEQTLVRAYSIGVMDYIIKPFNKFILFSKLRRCAVLIEMKRKLERSVEHQKHIKQRLIQLNEYIRQCLKLDDIDSLVAMLMHVKNIVPIDGMVVASPVKTGTFSLIRLIPHELLQAFMPQLNKLIYVQAQNSVMYFSRPHSKIYGVRVSLQQYGFVFLIRNEPFSSDEKNIIGLLAEILKIVISRTEIHQYVRKQNKMYIDEISKVRQIQVAQLPKFKNVKGYEIASTFLPAEDISGDFFDGFTIDDGVLQIILCDVSGHGVASSYIGNAIRTLIRTFSRYEKSPGEILQKVNRQMVRDGKGLYYFATALICRLLPDGHIVFASGGHPPLYLYRKKTHSIEELPNTGGLIGVFDDMVYGDCSITLDKDDMLLLYTDGLTESINMETRTLYGNDKLKEQILLYAQENPVEILHSLCGSMYEFTGYAPLEDDVTLICIKKV